MWYGKTYNDLELYSRKIEIWSNQGEFYNKYNILEEILMDMYVIQILEVQMLLPRYISGILIIDVLKIIQY